eukprot:gene5030-3372_t
MRASQVASSQGGDAPSPKKRRRRAGAMVLDDDDSPPPRGSCGADVAAADAGAAAGDGADGWEGYCKCRAIWSVTEYRKNAVGDAVWVYWDKQAEPWAWVRCVVTRVRGEGDDLDVGGVLSKCIVTEASAPADQQTEEVRIAPGDRLVNHAFYQKHKASFLPLEWKQLPTPP